MAQDEGRYTAIIEKQRKDLDAVARRLKETCTVAEETVYRKDVYLNLKDVLKRDIIVMKKRFFDKDVELMRDKTKLASIRTEHTNKIKLSKRCRLMLDTVERTTEEMHLERSSKINSFCEVLARKQTNQHNREIREREIEEAMTSAMIDKLPEEKEWNRILQAHWLLKGVLRSKMERLMLAHSAV